jgi:hypothetical protein
MPVEDPMFTAFRQAILPQLAKQYQQAGTPLYGAPEKAAFLGTQNKLFNSGVQNTAAAMAARGGLQSGLMDSAVQNLAANRANNASSFFSQIPAMNRQYSDTRTGNLLNLATNFLGKSPLGQTSQSSQTGTSTSTGASQGTNTQYGPDFMSSFMNSLGGLIPMLAGGGGSTNLNWGNPNPIGGAAGGGIGGAINPSSMGGAGSLFGSLPWTTPTLPIGGGYDEGD